MHMLYQDAMAIVRKMAKPDLFITFTCNPNWIEIKRELLVGQTPTDRPDLCCRVFMLKLKELMKDLYERDVLGKVIGRVQVIEFQKRGLPHAHILLILSAEDKPRSIDDYDELVCAEIPDPTLNKELYETVTKCMIHGPCHVLMDSPCLNADKICTKKYPKKFVEITVDSNEGYPLYRRRNDKKYIKC